MFWFVHLSRAPIRSDFGHYRDYQLTHIYRERDQHIGGVPQYMLSERKIERKIAEIKRHLKKSFQRTMWPGRLDYIFGGLMS